MSLGIPLVCKRNGLIKRLRNDPKHAFAFGDKFTKHPSTAAPQRLLHLASAQQLL